MKYSLWIRYYSEKTGLAEDMRFSGAVLNDLLVVLGLWIERQMALLDAWLFAEDSYGNSQYYGLNELATLMAEVNNND